MSSPRLPKSPHDPDLTVAGEEFFFPDVRTTVNLFAIHTRSVGRDWSYPPHEHPQYEINIVLAGEQIMVVDGRSYIQRQGDLMLLRPGIVHSSCSNGEGFTYFCMHFDIDDKLFLSLLSRLEQVLFPADGTVARQMEPALGKLLDLSALDDMGINGDSVAKRMRIQSAVFELFATLWEAVSSEAAHLPGRGYVQAELAHQIASRLQGRVNLSYRQAGSLEKQDGIEGISSELGISVSHCNRVFRSVFGVSPRVYLSELVLHEAKLLLADPQWSVQQIADLLGYGDIAHFSRQFKRWSGQSPTSYRKSVAPESSSE
ncbi:helix-turn-helix domain-containing protein [Paenibacillus polymyxa]|uniref:AraC family transcriptional regulator n=1 Tax=Paenibacillus polymyxa (strain SC2) TaxID=886882 RepID=E3E7E4_PAEPS|nr:AraC family transcriptional regulator [Paenibacillus polymyxa]ADO59155.1 AraC family transcriptional regulator [Paenibacillus polymyxa SC2]MCV9950095.1 AraC family transcriptional regulator [Paenibacillus sp. BT-177]WPQ56733.1 AraC family transcriptional regulator [Paenibacillus polymyxa]CCI71665.1 HTH-type transcriptional activator RhaR [Paenibacillus polymyxa M1]